MIYRPRPSKLVSRGRAHGLDAWDGLGMLVEQGALAFEHWTELEAPRRVMRAAADRALEVGLDQLPNRR
jgi:shikimate dehydrogenase